MLQTQPRGDKMDEEEMKNEKQKVEASLLR